MKDILWHWMGTAPPKVVLAITLLGGTALATWVWAIDARMSIYDARYAARNEQIKAIENVAQLASIRLDRMEDKIDKLLVQSAELSIEIRRSRYQARYPTVNFDIPPEPKPPATTKFLQPLPSPNPLTNRENK